MPESDHGEGLPRRAFLRRAVATGGAAALAACLDRESTADVPRGGDPAERPARQHAWNAASATDDDGNVRQPRHRVLLALDYDRDGPPTASDRDELDAALRALDRAYAWGTDGLFATVGYSPAYFARFDADGPAGVDLPAPEPLAPFEDPEPDTPDALVHLASDHASAVLAAEEALRGERETVNGVDAAPLPDALTVADRRTGFVGAGLPAEHDDPDGVPGDAVPDESPLFMGFKSGFSGNQASEDRVTISEGPFAGGSTQHLSKIHLDLEQWYEQDDREDRVAKMFCPAHASEGRVEGVGDNLGSDSGMGECPVAHDDAREEGTVGHSQKMTDVREDDSPIILRRDFNTTGDGRPGVHFLSLQRDVGDFVATREAMNATALAEETGVGQRSNNGILQYMTVERRGNFLLPPRSLRALPPARP